MLALPPAQAAVLVTTLLFPAPLMQTKSSRLPVLPTPFGFVTVLSPALLPLAFESEQRRRQNSHKSERCRQYGQSTGLRLHQRRRKQQRRDEHCGLRRGKR